MHVITYYLSHKHNKTAVAKWPTPPRVSQLMYFSVGILFMSLPLQNRHRNQKQISVPFKECRDAIWNGSR